jgi:hypothetical protein
MSLLGDTDTSEDLQLTRSSRGLDLIMRVCVLSVRVFVPANAKYSGDTFRPGFLYLFKAIQTNQQ